MKARFALLVWLIPVLSLSILCGTAVFITDPFFHYRKPCTERYFYVMDNERSQNDGILKHFDYDALIIGSSMTQNFETSEFDALFDVHSVKTPFKGASFREISDNLTTAFKWNPGIRTVIRALDYVSITGGTAPRKSNLPDYLYDRNPFNDVKYLLNRDVIFNRSYEMISETYQDGFAPGITTFDDYDRFYHPSGLGAATYEGIQPLPAGNPVHLTEEDQAKIRENILLNVVSVAQAHPETDFYVFFTPYSAAWWQSVVSDGTIYQQIEAEKVLIELILPCRNIHLFSFNLRTDITTDMNNYSDPLHYSTWINSLILKWLYDGTGLLTQENYLDYLDEELDFYLHFDYLSLNNMPDYENDLYAAALLNQELTGTEPVSLSSGCFDSLEMRFPEEGIYGYLAFEYQVPKEGNLSVIINNETGDPLDCFISEVSSTDGGWHQQVINLTGIHNPCSVAFQSAGGASFRQAALY